MSRKENEAPLLQALDEYIKREFAYFAIPGHRYERGMPELLAERFGSGVYRYDLTESYGLDDLHNAKGAIREAQNAAARLFGADECRFCVNGTTALIETMILGCAGPGEEIIVARDAHRSAISGLILSGARPVWLMPEYDESWGIPDGYRPETVEQLLEEHPKAKAVLIVSPNYYGQASDIAAIADICHGHGVPLLVDAAHGSHFAFGRDYPADAVSAGADLTAMSIHKTAGSMTQSSLLFYREMKIKRNEERRPGCTVMENVDAALKMTISSSPSYVLMASLDAARAHLEAYGSKEAGEAVKRAQKLRKALEQAPGVRVRGGSDPEELKKRNMDITRVVFRAEGISGTELMDRLAAQEAVAAEMADALNVVAVITAANTDQEIQRLVKAMEKIAEHRNGRSGKTIPWMKDMPAAKRIPREAYFAPKETLPLSKAQGRICADILCAYPPGIAAVVPGEVLTEQVVNTIQELINTGIPIQGITEDHMVRVLKEEA